VTRQVEARYVTNDSTVDLDDPVRRRAVVPQPRPPSLEVRSIIGLRRRERGLFRACISETRRRSSRRSRWSGGTSPTTRGAAQPAAG